VARYKVLKSVAHNVGHSFTSLMNYADDDYVMGHLLRFARRTGLDTLTIDFVKGEAGPRELLAPPISDVPSYYIKKFWDIVASHGSDRALIQNATLTLQYDISIEQPLRVAPELAASPYICDVRITDIRGKQYRAHFRGWWYPERTDSPQWKSSWRLTVWNWIRAIVPHR
jgi:hypothetical protein